MEMTLPLLSVVVVTTRIPPAVAVLVELVLLLVAVVVDAVFLLAEAFELEGMVVEEVLDAAAALFFSA